MKRLLFILLCTLCITRLDAQTRKKVYLYGVDFSYAKVYAASESVEQFAKAFENINILIITEPKKYDFSRVLGRYVNVVLEPMLKIVSSCDYTNLKSWSNLYEDPQYTTIVSNYDLPQTSGIGVVMIAKLLDKPMGRATYELITFDIETREIISKREVSGKAGGFGLRNYWAGSIHSVIKSVRL